MGTGEFTTLVVNLVEEKKRSGTKQQREDRSLSTGKARSATGGDND